MRTSTPGSPRKGYHRRGIASAVALTALLAGLLSAPAASAIDVDSGDSTNPPISNPGGGGNPGTGGGGGTSTPTYRYVSFLSVVTPPGSYVEPGCAATDALGQANLGARITYRGPYSMSANEILGKVRLSEAQREAQGIEFVSRTCIYPPSYVDRVVRVVVRSDASMSRFAPDTATLGTSQDVSAWGRGDHSLSGLYASQSTFASLSATPTVYGRYRGTAISTVQSVTVRHWTGSHPITGETYADEIVGVGAEYKTNPAAVEGYLTCAGWTDGAPDRTYTWTESDCGGPNPSTGKTTYTCSVPSQPVAINGQRIADDPRTGTVRNHAYVTRSGEPITLGFEVPSITGEGLVSINSTSSRLTRAADSTPWQSGRDPQEQDVFLALPGGHANLLQRDGSATTWQPGSHADWQARYYWASDAGHPTVLTGQYQYAGTWERQSVRIVGFVDGRWVTEPVVVRINSTALCSTEQVTFMVTRTVNNG